MASRCVSKRVLYLIGRHVGLWLTRNFLFDEFAEVVGLPLVWRATSVPEKQPL